MKHQLQQEIDISQWNDFKQENAQDWIAFGIFPGLLSVIQDVLRGGYKCPSLAFGIFTGLLSVIQDVLRGGLQIKSPALLRKSGLLSVIQDVLRGGYKRPSLAFGEEGRFDLFAFESKL